MNKLWIVLLTNFYVFQIFAQDFDTNKTIVSLKNNLKDCKNEIAKIDIINSIGNEYINISNPVGLDYAAKSLKLSEKNNYTEGKIDAYRLYGKYYNIQFDSKNAVLYFNKAIEIAYQINDKIRLAKLYNGIGNSYMNINDYDKALNAYLNATKINEKEKNEGNLYDNYSNLADLYLTLGANEKFVKYNNLAINLAFKIKEEFNLCYNYSLLVKYFSANNNFDSAEIYANKSIQMSAKYNNINDLAIGYIALGSVFVNKRNYFQSIEYFNKGLKLHEQLDNKMGIASVLNELGKAYFLYYNQNKNAKYLNKAEDFFLKSNSYYITENLIDGLVENYNYLSQISEIHKNYIDAYEYHKLYTLYKDSIFNSESKETIKSLEDRRIIEEQENNINIKQLQLKSKIRQSYFYLAGIGLFAIIGGLLFRQSRNRKRTNQKLQTLNKELNQANQIKTRFFGILNHDLRSPVANLIHFLHLQKENPELLDEETRKQYENKTIEGAENLLVSMEDLLLWSKGQMENFKPQPKNIRIESLFTDTKKIFSGYIHIQFLYENPQDIEVYTDENYLKTIVRNLISNAINAFDKKENATITCKAWQEHNHTFISVTDNGSGANQKQFDALYDDQKVVGIKNGLGLHLIRDMAKAIHCEIIVDSQINEGTCFVLKF